MRYRALVLDHDDTVMDSTRLIHYPAFLLGMSELRPDVTMTLSDFFRINMEPGIVRWYRETARLDDAEYKREYEIWQSYVDTHVPEVFPGAARLIRRFHKAGGLLFVSSHSVSSQIRRDWAANGLPEPDGIYGFDLPEERRKPDPFALRDIMERFALTPDELLVVDDLRFGCEMARSCGVRFAGAGWAYDVPEIREYMQSVSDVFFTDPAGLEREVFGE